MLVETRQLQGGSHGENTPENRLACHLREEAVLLGVPKGPSVSWRALKQAWDSFHKLEVLHLRAPAPGCAPGVSKDTPWDSARVQEDNPARAAGRSCPREGAAGQPGAASQAQLQGWVSCRARFWSRAAKPVTRVYGSHCPRGQLQASPPGQGLVKGCWSWKPWQLLIP